MRRVRCAVFAGAYERGELADELGPRGEPELPSGGREVRRDRGGMQAEEHADPLIERRECVEDLAEPGRVLLRARVARLDGANHVDNVTSVWGSSPTDAWAVGDQGTITHWNGKLWTVTSSGTMLNLRGIGGLDQGNAWGRRRQRHHPAVGREHLDDLCDWTTERDREWRRKRTRLGLGWRPGGCVGRRNSRHGCALERGRLGDLFERDIARPLGLVGGCIQ